MLSLVIAGDTSALAIFRPCAMIQIVELPATNISVSPSVKAASPSGLACPRDDTCVVDATQVASTTHKCSAGTQRDVAAVFNGILNRFSRTLGRVEVDQV